MKNAEGTLLQVQNELDKLIKKLENNPEAFEIYLTALRIRQSILDREEAGVTPESIRSIADIERIPFTTKDDLRSQYPLNLVIVPHSKLVRMHCSSGTTGTPTAIAHTQNDLNVWADLMARCLHMVGVTKDDVFQNMSGYGLFTGGPEIVGSHRDVRTLDECLEGCLLLLG